MTTDELHELFQQTLQGDYEDETPWNAVSKIRSNGSREVFYIAAEWLKDNSALRRARAAAILAQLRLPSEVPTDKPEWLFRDETYPLIVEMLKKESDPMVLDSAVAAL